MSGSERFGEDEAQEILKLAARQSAGGGTVSRDELWSMGAELGLSREQIEAAIRQRTEQRELAEDRKAFARYRRSKAWSQVSSGLSFAVLLFGLNFLTTSNKLDFGSYWAIWPVGFVALFSLVGFLESWRPKDRQAEFERWRAKRREKAPVEEPTPAREVGDAPPVTEAPAAHHELRG